MRTNRPSMVPKRGSARRPRWALHPALLLLAVALASAPAPAANTDPTLALMRATAVRSTSGRVTVTLEGSFSLADAVQLALPLDIVVTQGSRRARYDLGGQLWLSVAGGVEQPLAGPGVLAIDARAITLVLPAEFDTSEATAQILGGAGGESIASNRLRFMP